MVVVSVFFAVLYGLVLGNNDIIVSFLLSLEFAFLFNSSLSFYPLQQFAPLVHDHVGLPKVLSIFALFLLGTAYLFFH